MEQNKKKRNRLPLLLLLLAVVSTTTGGLYGYWAENIENPDSVEKQGSNSVGVAKTIKGEIRASQDYTVVEKLVPTGMVSKSEAGAVDTFTQQLTASWVDPTNVVKSSDNVNGTLTITPVVEFADPQYASDNATIQKLVKPVIQYTNGQNTVLNGDEKQATLTVTMLEPDNKDEYLKVKGKAIKIKLTYALVQ